jgi:hypothetical protein
MNSSQFSDPGSSTFLGEISSLCLQNPWTFYHFETWLPLKLAPETEYEMKNVGSRSGMKKFLDPDPVSNIPDPQHCSTQDNLLKGNKS